MAGKGDRPRPGVYSQEFRDNFDKIFGDRRVKKPGLAKEKKGNAALDDDGQVDDDYKAELWCGISLVINSVSSVLGKKLCRTLIFVAVIGFITT